MGGVESACGCGGTPPMVQHESFFEYSGKLADGTDLNFETLTGKVVLVMNVASE